MIKSLKKLKNAITRMGTYDIIDDRCVFWTWGTEIEDNLFSDNGDFSEVV